MSADWHKQLGQKLKEQERVGKVLTLGSNTGPVVGPNISKANKTRRNEYTRQRLVAELLSAPPKRQAEIIQALELMKPGSTNISFEGGRKRKTRKSKKTRKQRRRGSK